jgi:peptidoglycan/LPS O-acetylase OafA/YrhL
MRRVPELDALRAFAAAVVLLFHLRPPIFVFGSTGVDLFFVLSGYLITKIILDNSEAPGFFRNFYARRGLRIWPIYYLSLLALVALNPFLSKPQPLTGLPYYLTYTQNIQYYWHREPAPFHVAFRHTWTLALEEQFYILWPALVMAVGQKRLIKTCLLVVALAFCARDGLFFGAPYSLYILPSRCDGFALGGLLAAMLKSVERGTPRHRQITRAFLSIFVASTGYIGHAFYRQGMIGFLGLPTPAAPGATMLAVNLFYFGLVGTVVCTHGHRALAPLRLRPLAYLGQISYGIYMYHYMTYWALDGFGAGFNDKQSWDINILKVAATLVLSMLSWELIERPILSLKDKFRYRPRVAHRPEAPPTPVSAFGSSPIGPAEPAPASPSASAGSPAADRRAASA